MARKPKLTPNFADKVADSPPAPMVTSFPTSRIVGSQDMGSLYSAGLTGQPLVYGAYPLQGMQQVSLAPTATQFAPPPPARRYKVALIGTAPSSRDLAPFTDMAWDIWACSPGNMNVLPRVDAWFEVHANLHHPQFADLYGKAYIKWLSEQPFPVYMQDEEWHPKYFPHARKFPAQELVVKYKDYWFGSSFAWMIAFAIQSGYTEVGLYGIDMASKEEYIQQRQSFYRWLEIAADAGVKVTIPPESDLARPPGLYGYSEATPKGRKHGARHHELKSRSEAFAAEMAKAEAAAQALRTNKTYIDGAIEDNEYETSIWPERDLWGPVRRPETVAAPITEPKQVASG